jgi:hypothetical protein
MTKQRPYGNSPNSQSRLRPILAKSAYNKKVKMWAVCWAKRHKRRMKEIEQDAENQ